MPEPLTCSKCGALWPEAERNRAELTPCASCGVPGLVWVFPAHYRGLQPGQTGEDLLAPSESGCYHHPTKRAVVSCDGCGRFLCALCQCELHGQNLCPSCLESGQRKGRLRTLQNHRNLYDNQALSLALLPMLLFYVTIITAPAALWLVVRHWNSPGSLLPRTRIRFVLALLLASLQILGWIALGVIVLYRST